MKRAVLLHLAVLLARADDATEPLRLFVALRLVETVRITRLLATDAERIHLALHAFHRSDP